MNSSVTVEYVFKLHFFIFENVTLSDVFLTHPNKLKTVHSGKMHAVWMNLRYWQETACF